MLAARLQPLEPFQNVDHPWKCHCADCGRIVTPTYSNVRAGNGGCRFCAAFGLDWEAPAVVYLLVHNEYLSLKIGIAKREPHRPETARVKRLSKYGWVPFATVVMPTGRSAHRVEQAILRWWRVELDMPPHLGQTETEGWTETVSSDSVSVTDVWDQVLRLKAEIQGAAEIEGLVSIVDSDEASLGARWGQRTRNDIRRR